MLETKSIEDLLEVLSGFVKSPEKFEILPNDGTIVHSIARQVFKGTALTDRQFALMQTKLQTYKPQFEVQGYDFDHAIDKLRKPLRKIDRSKYIKIVEAPLNYPKEKWVAVRFPFSKTLITCINEVPKHTDQYHHNKGSHEHFFLATESNIYAVIKKFINKDFEIDNELITYYNKCKDIVQNTSNLVSYVDNTGVHNISDSIRTQMSKDLGNFDPSTVINYADKYRRYGISESKITFDNPSVQNNIATRSNLEYYCPTEEVNFKEVLLSLYNLDRFPLLVNISPGHEMEQVYEIYDFFRALVPIEQQSVLFRLDNETNRDFNKFIKEKNLNNWVDKYTKIVYINNKLSKVLLKSGWKPITTLMFSQSSKGQVAQWFKAHSDLIVIRGQESYLRKYSSYHGYM